MLRSYLPKEGNNKIFRVGMQIFYFFLQVAVSIYTSMNYKWWLVESENNIVFLHRIQDFIQLNSNRLQSARRQLIRKSGLWSSQLSVPSSAQARCAHRWAGTLSSLLTCRTEKETKLSTMSSNSLKIGAAIDLVLPREFHRVTSSKQSLSIITCE